MAEQEIWLIYSTFKNRAEALSVAQTLLEKRLIACANVHDGVTSLYRWQGAITQEKEVALTAKTRKEKLQATMDEIRAVHSYELPCIVAYPVTEGLPEFLQWVINET